MKTKTAEEIKAQLPEETAPIPFDGFIVLNDGESYSRLDGCIYVGRTGQYYDLKHLLLAGMQSMNNDISMLMSAVLGNLTN